MTTVADAYIRALISIGYKLFFRNI